MNNFKQRILVFLSVSILGLGSVFGQAGTVAPAEITAETSSVTLKTVRALFPDVPVAVANELFGGLHSVPTIADLHGTSTATFGINDSMLQTGMLVYVESETMYFRYKGADFTGASAIYNVHNDAIIAIGNYNEDMTYWESLDQIIASGIQDSVHFSVGVATDTATSTGNYRSELSIVGDVLIDTVAVIDTTWIFTGDKWVVLSTEVTGNQLYSTPSDTLNVAIFEGDFYRNADSTFIRNDVGQWELMSVLDTLSAETFQVYVDTDGDDVNEAWFTEVATQLEFRALLNESQVALTGHVDKGLTISYPATWGDFTYSILIGGSKYEMTNGISSTITEVDSKKYKKVVVSARDKAVVIE